MIQRDLAGQAVVVHTASPDPLGYVVRSGRGEGGGWGHWILDRTSDPGAVQGLAEWAQDWHVRLAVIGETVCPRPWGHCWCGLAHVDPDTLAWLPRSTPAAPDPPPDGGPTSSARGSGRPTCTGR